MTLDDWHQVATVALGLGVVGFSISAGVILGWLITRGRR